jgi:hypothetical protein
VLSFVPVTESSSSLLCPLSEYESFVPRLTSDGYYSPIRTGILVAGGSSGLQRIKARKARSQDLGVCVQSPESRQDSDELSIAETEHLASSAHSSPSCQGRDFNCSLACGKFFYTLCLHSLNNFESYLALRLHRPALMSWNFSSNDIKTNSSYA